MEAPGGRRLDAAQIDLGAEAGMNGVATAHPQRRSSARELLHLAQLLPHHAGDGAGAIAELQAQIVAAVAPLPALDLADQQHLVDVHAVAELVQQHALKVDPTADGTRAAAPTANDLLGPSLRAPGGVARDTGR